jgi:probable F420-dependent oxidoreductase
MLVDFAASVGASPLEAEAAAVTAEKEGFDGFGGVETRHDVFTTLTLAARATSRITLQSAIAVAFARNPMSLAVQANDVQLISEGRFQLGLGSQVKPHIERRFAMPWSRPAARMEEFIGAVRAIWTAWATGDRLAFRGEFYTHTLMTDFFNPGPNPYGNPPIYLAAVGELMTAVAARVADGLMVHPLTTEAYLRERTVPGVRAARGTLDGFSFVLPVLTVLGEDEAARAVAAKAIRGQIAFYGSTPAYRAVLDMHGWGDLADAIDDDVLDAFAVSGNAAEVAAGLRTRFGDLIDRISLYTPYEVDPAQVVAVAAAVRA